jgi:beta-phosphoglucomutase-like phosphatase (HAD superfamily)
MCLELVISDLDGTILETEDYHRLAYNALFEELELGRHWSKQEYIDRLQTLGGNKIKEIFSWMNLPDEEYSLTKKKLYFRKTELYVELITEDLAKGKLVLRPGISDLFNELKKNKIPIAIGTACVGWAAEKVVQAALGESFLNSLTCLCGGESTFKQKPAPDIYLLVAEKSGVNPQNCLVLEDTQHGMAAAKNGGMKCVVSPSEFAQEHDFSCADMVVPEWSSPSINSYESLQELFC